MLATGLVIIRSRACRAALGIVCALALHTVRAEDRVALSGVPASTVTAGSYYHFRPTLSGAASGAKPWFRVAAKPRWASFDEANGELSGTPTQQDTGTSSGIRIWVWVQGGGYAPLPPFSITVKSATAPRISGTPARAATVGTPYSFTPAASGPSGHKLAFAIRGKPSWAAFDTLDGRLSGTPGSGNVGTFAAIVISVSDGATSASLPSFSITVAAAAGQALTIGGSPKTTVTAGSAYAFSPSVSDPGKEALSFSIQNKPDWASFSIASGALSGTPSASQAGVYGDILISVSDGSRSVSLPAFAITVTTPVVKNTGVAALSWTAPATNTDGSALTDLAGYYVYYGSAPGSMTQSIQLPSPTETSYSFSSLPAGTWYFGVVAYTSAGTQSSVSGTAQITIP